MVFIISSPSTVNLSYAKKKALKTLSEKRFSKSQKAFKRKNFGGKFEGTNIYYAE